MANYKPDLSSQNKCIPIDFSQQIMPCTFEYALVHIVDNHLHLSCFDKRYDNDKKVAVAYSPSVMLKIILFGYSRRFITIHRIANACETNITLMSLSGDVQPH
jgi:transposase